MPLPTYKPQNAAQAAAAAQNSSSPFRVRRARRGDADALQALLRELGYPDAADVQTVHWVCSHPEIEVFVVADPQDKPVAMASLSHRPQLRFRGRFATVDEFVVAEQWRRKGVGTALMKALVERARTLSVKRLELISHGGRSPEEHAFYAACGFVEAQAFVMRHQDFESQR